jgi:hypothetical protein
MNGLLINDVYIASVGFLSKSHLSNRRALAVSLLY